MTERQKLFPLKVHKIISSYHQAIMEQPKNSKHQVSYIWRGNNLEHLKDILAIRFQTGRGRSQIKMCYINEDSS